MPKSLLPNNFILDRDILAGYAEDVSGETLMPEYLVRPESVEETAEVLNYCQRERLSVTPAGKQTNDTASSLAQEGLCLSTERMKSVLEINKDELFAVAEPGVILGELKQKVEAKGLFYPPDPSSEHDASLGGTVATNASGARSYKYGPTANHILELEVVLPNGSIRHVSKQSHPKTTVGPCAVSGLADFWIGSEGIFGVISKIKVQLQPQVPQAIAVMAFFTKLDDLLRLCVSLKSGALPSVSPRALEFFDESCLRFLKAEGRYAVPDKAKAALILEQEFDSSHDKLLNSWLSVLERSGALVSDSIAAESPTKIAQLRQMRHFIPERLNALGDAARKQGGRKISTDWAVPVEHLEEMMKKSEKLSSDFGFPPERVYRYAHIGDGHPHFNYIPQDSLKLGQCLELRRELSKLAVSLGGTVAAEHGIGKLRKDLLLLEPHSTKLQLLRALKRELDPHSIMSPGNLLP